MKKPVFEAYADPRDWVAAFRVWEREAAWQSIIDTFTGVTGLEPKFCAVLNADASEKGEPFPFKMPDFWRSAPFFLAVETVEGEVVMVDVAAGEGSVIDGDTIEIRGRRIVLGSLGEGPSEYLLRTLPERPALA